jgi:hypothetical protein
MGDATVNARPLLLELVGLAGTGKSSLGKAISHRNENIRLVTPPRKAKYVPFLIRNALNWLPTYIYRYGHTRWFTWKEMMLMAHLTMLPTHLKQQSHSHGTVAILDPGAFCWLTELREFGPPIATCQRYESWWSSMFDRWAALVDTIIWLDAPDEILLERIHTRDQWHEVQCMSPAEAVECFARYRKWYGEMISGMMANDSPRVLRFRTDQVSTDQMASEVLAALNLVTGQNVKQKVRCS